MTPSQIASLYVLAAILAVSILRKVNIGVVALVATLVLAAVTHTNVAKALGAFPASLVILIVGVTLLFAHAERSGAVTWLVDQALRVIGDRHWIIPWIGFVLGAALSTIGAFPTAPISLLLPILAHLARTYRLNYLMMAVICVLGSNAAGLSPLSPAGALVGTLVQNARATYSPWGLYGLVMAMHVVVAGAIFLAQGGYRRVATGVACPVDCERVSAVAATGAGVTSVGHIASSTWDSIAGIPGGQERTGPTRFQRSYRVASLISLLLFVLITVLFKLDVGLTAVTMAFLLQVTFRPPEAELIKKVPWGVVLLLGGLVIYLNLLGTIGTLDAIEHALAGIASPALLILVVSYITAIISNMESSTLAVLGVMVPVALSVAGASAIEITALMVAVVMSAAVVVMSPLHVAGALIIANTPNNEQQVVFRRLLIWSAVLTAIVPGVAALFPILLA